MRLYSTIDRYLRDCCPCRCCTPTNSRAPTFEIVVPTSLLFSFFFSKNRPCRSIEPVRLILFVPFSLFSLSVSWECSSSIDSISSIARNVQEKTILEIHGEWYGGSIRICKQRERFISRGSLCKRSRLCTSFFGRDSNSKESRNSKEKVFFPRLGMFSLLSRIFSTRPNEQFPLSSEFGLVPVLRGSRVSIQLPSGGQRDHRHSKILTEIESWGTINRNCRWEGDKLRETRVNLPFVRWFSIALQIQTRRNTIQRLLFPRFSVFFFFSNTKVSLPLRWKRQQISITRSFFLLFFVSSSFQSYSTMVSVSFSHGFLRPRLVARRFSPFIASLSTVTRRHKEIDPNRVQLWSWDDVL